MGPHLVLVPTAFRRLPAIQELKADSNCKQTTVRTTLLTKRRHLDHLTIHWLSQILSRTREPRVCPIVGSPESRSIRLRGDTKRKPLYNGVLSPSLSSEEISIALPNNQYICTSSHQSRRLNVLNMTNNNRN